MSQRLRILYEDDAFVAIDKPSGFSVHTPEDPSIRIPRHTNCLFVLRDQIQKYVYPVHRLDRATSGIVLYALTKEAASSLNAQFVEKKVQKKYLAVARGWTDERGSIEKELRNEDDTAFLDAKTTYERLAKVELPFKSNPQFETSRYSLVLAEPETGRFHQIRRHFNSNSNHLIGDTRYGNGVHNRYFRSELGIDGLLLRAIEIEFEHPTTKQKMKLTTDRWGDKWHKVFNLFGFCYRF